MCSLPRLPSEADRPPACAWQAAQVLESDAAPAVYAEWLHARAGAPTILLYAHADVQPAAPGPPWRQHPFEPWVEDGAVYGRGAQVRGGAHPHMAEGRSLAYQAWRRKRACRLEPDCPGSRAGAACSGPAQGMQPHMCWRYPAPPACASAGPAASQSARRAGAARA